MGRRAVLLALVAACLAWPSVAMGAVGQLDGTTMVYTADPSETNQVVVTLDTANSSYLVQDQPGVTVQALGPCQPGPNSSSMECPQGLVTDFRANLDAGNDTISIQASISTSIGAGAGQDVMNGGPAVDFLRGGQGSDTISGGAGNDQLVGDDPGFAGGGNDTLSGGTGNDSADGQDGNDNVRGGDGNDALAGGNGDDVFPAEAVGDGTDVVSGGPGTDTATYDQRTDPLQLSLDDVANDGFQGNAADNVQTDVENLVGGSAGDTISGSPADNALDGGGGNDSLTGLAGDDALTGGAGNDNEDGGDGADVLSGGDGGDAMQGGEGADNLDGGTGDDALDGGTGPDLMVGGEGSDLGNYGSRTEPLTVTLDGNANDGAAGEADNVQTDVENLLGGAGADTFIGSPAANTFDGGAGENYEDGAAGADTLIGGASGDVLRTRGSADGDIVTCGPGPDFVIAKPADTIAPDCDRADRGINQKPKLRDSAVVAPVRGTLQMSPTGIVRRVPLQDKVVLPLSSIVDTVAGAVKVTSSATTRKIQTVALDSGVFDIRQTATKLAVTQFSLLGGDFSVCPAAARGATSAIAAAKPKTVRSLWANGKGQFRTKGRYATAAIRGTRWQTVDRCDGTLVRVTAGAVTVRDLVRKKSVVVKAGHSYLAKAR